MHGRRGQAKINLMDTRHDHEQTFLPFARHALRTGIQAHSLAHIKRERRGGWRGSMHSGTTTAKGGSNCDAEKQLVEKTGARERETTLDVCV